MTEMKDRELIDIAGDVVTDALSLFGIPAATLKRAVRAFVDRRMQVASDVLLEEMRQGRVDSLHVANEDDAIAIIHRYLLAARDGAGKRNLRLLAKVTVGLAQRDQLYADEFNKYADICARLTRDQIFVIGRAATHFRGQDRDPHTLATITARIHDRFVAEMVPTHFPTLDHLRVVIWQLNGLGLAQGVPWEETMFQPSALTEEIVHLADFEDLLREDGDNQKS
jgi:hypothetical protein